jgi:hypothetical protein
LCLYDEWRESETKSENDREPDPPYGHLGRRMAGGSLAEEACHSLTRSARARVVGDRETPMVLAVLRLTTSVHLVIGPPPDQSGVLALRRGFTDLGYVEGRTHQFEIRCVGVVAESDIAEDERTYKLSIRGGSSRAA